MLPAMRTPKGVEAVIRQNERDEVLFLLNHTDTEQRVTLPSDGENLLKGMRYGAGEELILPAHDAVLYKKAR